VPESAGEEVGDRLAGLLPAEALQDALAGLAPEEITGPGGLVTQLAGRVLETALGAELTEHLGFPPGQAPPGGAGNHRNGSTAKACAHRARDGRGQDAAGPQRLVRAAAGQEAPDPSRRPG
jgi:putative transposase